jgi:hypothetical protein
LKEAKRTALRARDLLRNLATAAVALAVGFGIAEGLARLVLPPPERVRLGPARPASPVPEPHEPLTVAEAGTPEQLIRDTPTGRRLEPNAHVTIENHRLSHSRIEITTNELGYRNPPLGAKTATRILFLGDSITFADYLNEPDTFVRLVEKLGAERGLRWETVNAGVGAVGTETELHILTETGLSVAPDAVVLDYYLNDFEDSIGRRMPPLPPLLARSWLLSHLDAAWTQGRARFGSDPAGERLRLGQLREAFLKTHKARRGDPLKDREAFNDLIGRRFRDWGGAWSPATWERIRPALVAMKRLASERRFRLYLVAFPVRPQVEAEFVEDEPQRSLLALAGELGIPTLDLLPTLRRSFRADPRALFFDHCHHTAEGSRRVAAEITGFLAAHEPTGVPPARP